MLTSPSVSVTTCITLTVRLARGGIALPVLHRRMAMIDTETDPLLRPARVWESVTDYHPTRHAKRMTQAEALVADAQAELARRGLAEPESIEVSELRSGPRGGVAGRLRLRFGVAVSGPLLLGRTRHMGGGLFAAVP